MEKLFIQACMKEEVDRIPIWIMRQAGRYLKEYMEVRRKVDSFLELCKNPNLAKEVTIQPIEIFDFDAAILFSDILVVPLEMGLKVEFIKDVGPKIEIVNKSNFKKLKVGKEVADRLDYVYKTIELIKKELPQEKALIGFSGSPWTLAVYMIEGGGTKSFNRVKRVLYENPKFLHQVLDSLTETIKFYLLKQIEAGADVIQIFDSWAGAIEPAVYEEFSWKYIIKIVDFLKEKSKAPIIVYPKGIGFFIEKVYGNFDVFGLDWHTPIKKAKEILGSRYVIQGNMEPARLYSKEAIKKSIKNLKEVMGKKGYIFNLGHGIFPDTPRENVKYLVELVRS